MTLPEEWFYSIQNTRKFLVDLLDRTQTPKVPKDIRSIASDCLKHFPYDFEIKELHKMYEVSHKNKNVIIDETNKELHRLANELATAQLRLNEVTSTLQAFISKY
jgi:hypothetical protein